MKITGTDMKYVFVILSLLLLTCASTSGVKTAYVTTTEEYWKTRDNSGKAKYECNCDKIIVSEKESDFLSLSKSFTDSIKIPFFINIIEVNQVIFRWQSDPLKFPQTLIQETITLQDIENREIPDELRKITRVLVPLAERPNDGATAIELARAPGSGPDSAVIPSDTASLDSIEISVVKTIFGFIHQLHSEYGLRQFQFEGNLEISTEGRTYDWNPKDLISCDPKEDFVCFWDKWLVHDYQAHRELKQYDKKDPYPYDRIENEDSTITKYRVKKDEVVKKPCNLRKAHEMLDDIFKNNYITITEKTDMIEFHMGLGMGIRNSWGLWSGKSHLIPLFKKMNITHPDDMSGYIFDTYKQRVIILNNNPDSLDSFYSNIGDVECKK